MRYSIENDTLRLTVDTHGAEAVSVIHKPTGAELLWSGDPSVWGRHAPILFPYTGKLTGGKMIAKGVEYAGGQHGFARDVEHAMTRHTADTLEFELHANPETLPKWPYAFVLRSTFVLDERDAEVIEQAADELRALLPPEGPVLVLGVGNRRVTADALGPRTVQKIFVTMGAGRPPVKGIRPVAAVAPGVSASIGLSLQQLAGALVREVRPTALICVDSLCSSEPQRLGRTLQFSDTGLCPAQPGSSKHLDAARLGLPVIAAGIPTLMMAQEGKDLVVTPRELDSVIAHGAALLGAAINRALQPRLSIAQLCWLVG